MRFLKSLSTAAVFVISAFPVIAVGFILMLSVFIYVGWHSGQEPDYQASPEEIIAFEDEARSYLDAKYEETMTLRGHAYYSGKPIYCFEVKASPVDNPKLVFSVLKSSGFWDDYRKLLWEKQAKTELAPVVKNFLSDKARVENVYNSSYDIIEDNNYDRELRRKEPEASRPLGIFINDDISACMSIKVNKAVKKNDVDDESKKVFALISYLNKQKIEVSVFDVTYKSGLFISIGHDGRRLSHIINLKRLEEFTNMDYSHVPPTRKIPSQ